MKNVITALLLLFGSILYAQPQDIINDEVLLKHHLEQSIYEIDSSANAVVLYEKGTYFFNGYLMQNRIEKTIKILGDDALNLANIVIPAGKNITVRKISGVTYNLQSDGKISKNAVERSDRLEEEISKDAAIIKLSLPNVKKGSIIHYTYQLETYSYFVPDWNFQDQYPKLTSVFETSLHRGLIYTTVERTKNPIKKLPTKDELNTCQSCYFEELSRTQNEAIWVRRNIPSYKKEPYMLSPENYLERLTTHITELDFNGVSTSLYKDWNSLNDDIFYKNDAIGGQVFAANGFLKDKVEHLTSGVASDLDKAKSIYKYVRDSIRFTEQVLPEGEDIKDVFRKKAGGVAGKNFLLAAMLIKSGLKAEPLLIATRNKECLNPFYARISDLNFVACKVDIDNRQYYLDASSPYLPFNQLAEVCYNDMARTINKKSTSVFLKSDSLRDKNLSLVTIRPIEATKMKMSIDIIPGAATAYELRSLWKSDSTEAYNWLVKKMKEQQPSLEITAKSVKNIANPDIPLKMNVEGTMNLGDDDLIYFDPYIVRFFQKNPFNAQQRLYPIDMEKTEDNVFILSFTLPQNYELDESPKSTGTRFQGSSEINFKNALNYDTEHKILKIQSNFSTSGTHFAVEEYSDLKKFFDNIVAEQSQKIVIKKSK